VENPQLDKNTNVKSVTVSVASQNVSEPEQGKMPKGEKCANHPWRDAYAQCSYCKRYFCYPDLVRYEGKEYCLEDLSKAPIAKGTFKVGPNRYTYVASLLLIVSSFFILYHTYPQITGFVGQISKFGIYGFLMKLSLSSEIGLVNLFVVVGLLISGVVVFRNSGVGLGFTILVIFIALGLFVFEYMNIVNTGAPNYYIYIIAMLIFDTVFTIVSRVEFVERLYEKKSIATVDWPKFETF
jgi:hypothetical protein